MKACLLTNHVGIVGIKAIATHSSPSSLNILGVDIAFSVVETTNKSNSCGSGSRGKLEVNTGLLRNEGRDEEGPEGG